MGILDFLVPILTLGQHTLGLVPVSGQFLDELKIGNITPSDFFFRLHICTSLSYRDDVWVRSIWSVILLNLGAEN